MILFRDAINAQVRLGAARHADGDFFAKEEIGMLAEGFRAFNGVVVRQGDDGHAALFTAVIDRGGLIVRFLADPGKAREVAHARSSGVEVQVASHEYRLNAGYEQHMKSERNEHESSDGTY